MSGAPDGEVWRPVPGWEGLFSVSDHGRVREEPWVETHEFDTKVCEWVPNKVMVAHEGRLLTPTKSRGYSLYHLGRYGRHLAASAHRLVLAAFVGPCPEGFQACHNNGNRRDNRLSNLRYGTVSENQFDRAKHGTAATGPQRRNQRYPLGDFLRALRGSQMLKEVAQAVGVSIPMISQYEALNSDGMPHIPSTVVFWKLMAHYEATPEQVAEAGRLVLEAGKLIAEAKGAKDGTP